MITPGSQLKDWKIDISVSKDKEQTIDIHKIFKSIVKLRKSEIAILPILVLTVESRIIEEMAIFHEDQAINQSIYLSIYIHI